MLVVVLGFVYLRSFGLNLGLEVIWFSVVDCLCYDCGFRLFIYLLCLLRLVLLIGMGLWVFSIGCLCLLLLDLFVFLLLLWLLELTYWLLGARL